MLNLNKDKFWKEIIFATTLYMLLIKYVFNLFFFYWISVGFVYVV